MPTARITNIGSTSVHFAAVKRASRWVCNRQVSMASNAALNLIPERHSFWSCHTDTHGNNYALYSTKHHGKREMSYADDIHVPRLRDATIQHRPRVRMKSFIGVQQITLAIWPREPTTSARRTRLLITSCSNSF